MKVRMFVIRLTLWIGIVADITETIRMAAPRLFVSTAGIRASIDDGFRFALLYGAPVMLGWTTLLFWVNLKPIERRGAFLCLIPTIAASVLVEIIGIRMGVLSAGGAIPAFILQSILICLSAASYRLAGSIGAEA
jgi:hypothetical protein